MKNIFASLGCLLLLSCSTAPAPTPLSAPSRTDQLHAILDRYFESFLKLHPLFASSIGDHRYDDQLEISITEAFRKREEALDLESLDAINRFGCRELPEGELYTCLTFQDELTKELDLHRADLDHFMPFNQFQSFFLDFAEIASGSSYVTFTTPTDYRNFMARMRKLPEVLAATEDLMRVGMRRRIVIPKALAEKGIKQLRALLPANPEESVFYKPLKNIPATIPLNEQTEISKTYSQLVRESVYPAYLHLLRFAQTEYLPRCRKDAGVGTLPGGKAYYSALARFHTTTDLSPDQIMALGETEVARIQKELKAAQSDLGDHRPLPQFFKSLRHDPKLFPFQTHESVLEAYHQIHATLLKNIPSHFRLTPKSAFEIKEVEKFKAETAGESYQNPSADGSRPGIFWVPIPDPRKYPKKSMESLFLHEAIPGHHFQISLQQESDLPRYRKFNGNNAYVEGWGLYSESLGAELGLYRDPYQRIGRLEYEMHRAIRLVVDTGMHWKGWSREKAIRYSLDHEPLDEDSVVAEIERYIAIPGQALAYKLGELKIQELKRQAKLSLGKNYDDRDFHEQILKDGPLSLSILTTKINRWLESQRHP